MQTQSEIELPESFLSFLKQSYSLIQDIKNQSKTREDFNQFEEAFERGQKKKFHKLKISTQFYGHFGSQMRQKRILKEDRKVYEISHKWHQFACQKSLLQLKNQEKFVHFLSIYKH